MSRVLHRPQASHRSHLTSHTKTQAVKPNAQILELEYENLASQACTRYTHVFPHVKNKIPGNVLQNVWETDTWAVLFYALPITSSP